MTRNDAKQKLLHGDGLDVLREVVNAHYDGLLPSFRGMSYYDGIEEALDILEGPSEEEVNDFITTFDAAWSET